MESIANTNNKEIETKFSSTANARSLLDPSSTAAADRERHACDLNSGFHPLKVPALSLSL